MFLGYKLDMRKLSLALIAIGLLLVIFPVLIGKFIIKSAAFVTAGLALIFLFFGIRHNHSLLKAESVLLLVAAIKFFFFPHLLLNVIGFVLIVTAFFEFIYLKNYSGIIVFIGTLILGTFTILNARAGLSTTSMILGIIITGTGLGLYCWPLISTDSIIKFSKIVKRKKGGTKIDIKNADVEEAEFREIDVERKRDKKLP